MSSKSSTQNNRYPEDAKKLFITKGPCSSAFLYILNRAFDNSLESEERAAEPLAGGIMLQGYQCGMLWGAALAAGAESFRRCEDKSQAVEMAIIATQNIVESFKNRTNTVECSDITNADWSSKLSFAKYFVSGKIVSCFKLADKWAAEAIESASEGISIAQNKFANNNLQGKQSKEIIEGKSKVKQTTVSCASEVAKKMGATDEEMVMVAGFAGGLGLCGNACGALSAAIWMHTLTIHKQPNAKSSLSNPQAKSALNAFYSVTDHEMLCQEITGKTFKTPEEHTQYIQNGGCEKLINALAES